MSLLNKGTVAARVLVTSDPDRSGNLICDGTSDETEINQAFTFLTSGRTWKEEVKLIGDFTIDGPIVVPDYTALDLTEAYVFLANGSNCNMIENSNQGAGNTTIEIIGGVLNGNVGNQGANSDGINFSRVGDDEFTGCIIRNTYIYDCYRDGIYFTRCVHSEIRGCQLRTNGSGGAARHGIMLDTYCYDNVIADCICESNTNHGISIEMTSHHNTVVGNVCEDNGKGIVVEVSDCRYNTFVGNVCNKNVDGMNIYESDHNNVVGNVFCLNYSVGLEFLGDAHHNNIVGNVFVANSQTSDNGAPNLLIDSDCDYNNIEGNLFRAGPETNKPSYGVLINNANCAYNRVMDNDFYDDGFGTAPFGDSGTSTIIHTLHVPFIAPIGTADWDCVPPSGLEVDDDTEGALTVGVLPPSCHQTMKVVVWAVGLAAPGAGAVMQIEFNMDAGQPDEAYNAETATVANKASDQMNFAINDVVTWTLTPTDDAEIGDLVAGDCFEIRVMHETVGNGDADTDALFRAVEIHYV